MYGNNNYGYNPYGNYLQQRPLQNIDQQQYIQPIQNKPILNGKQVDSIDVAKNSDYPLDGSVSYFPLIDGSAIVTKQLQTDGTSKIVVFKPTEQQKEEIKYITKEDMEKAINGLNFDELDDIKEELKELRQEFKEFKKNKKKEE